MTRFVFDVQTGLPFSISRVLTAADMVFRLSDQPGDSNNVSGTEGRQ